MHVIALLFAASLCNPCSDELLPPVFDVGVGAMGGGVAGLGVAATVLFIPATLLQLAGPGISTDAANDPTVVAVFIGGIVVVYTVGAGAAGWLRSNARDVGDPLAVGVVSAGLALASIGGAFATAVALGSGGGIVGLGVLAGGAVVTGIAAGVTAAATE